MATLTFEQARQCVLKELRAARTEPKIELVGLSEAAGRVLAEPTTSDRDYPALSRSVRDGFALRAADLPGDLFVIGEVRAGESFTGEIQPGEALENPEPLGDWHAGPVIDDRQHDGVTAGGKFDRYEAGRVPPGIVHHVSYHSGELVAVALDPPS